PTSFLSSSSFFIDGPSTTEIYTLSLHDALPISHAVERRLAVEARHRILLDEAIAAVALQRLVGDRRRARAIEVLRRRCCDARERSEEHTSELQSLAYLVCRLLLEKKKKIHTQAP